MVGIGVPSSSHGAFSITTGVASGRRTTTRKRPAGARPSGAVTAARSSAERVGPVGQRQNSSVASTLETNPWPAAPCTADVDGAVAVDAVAPAAVGTTPTFSVPVGSTIGESPGSPGYGRLLGPRRGREARREHLDQALAGLDELVLLAGELVEGGGRAQRRGLRVRGRAPSLESCARRLDALESSARWLQQRADGQPRDEDDRAGERPAEQDEPAPHRERPVGGVGARRPSHAVRPSKRERRPANLAASPSSSSMRSSWLYLATRSDLAGAPAFSCPAFTATARSATVVSSVSPERCEITER